MSQIEVTEAYPRCRRTSAPSCIDGRKPTVEELPLSIDEIKSGLHNGYRVAIYVDGWSEPWPCWINGDELRARCPTAPKVVPLVVSVSKEGAQFTGCDCECHHENALR